MNTLPTEIIQLILYNILDIKDYKRSCLVSKKWWKLLKDNAINVADANVYQKITYLPFNPTAFPSWTGKEISCTAGYLTNRMLHGRQIVHIAGYTHLLEANWRFGKLHGLYTCWRTTIGSYTLYIKHGEIKIINRHTADPPLKHISTNIYHICNYEHGEKNGDEIKFNILGEMSYSCQWNRGKKHGEEITSAGALNWHLYYNNDIQIGSGWLERLS